MASGMSPWTLKHVASVPYSDPPSRLRTLDIWLPQLPAGSSEKAPPPASDSGIWLVYVHGGAWRDPLKSSRCIEPTLSHLSSSSDAGTILNPVVGVASLNYRLSPYPSHPSHPSDPNDPERSARHPTHVRDVAEGLRFLQRQHGMKRWIGIGHSCGATLLSQLVSGIGLDEQGGGGGNGEGTSFTGGPEALILLEGIYNIPLMLKNHSPPGCPQDIADIYKTFVAGAFGNHDDNGATYLAVSPVSGKYNVQQWPEGRLLVLCHSYEDELVERAQRDVMCVALDRQGWGIVMEAGDEEDEVRAEGRRVLNVRDLQGRHDWICQDGKQIATLILDVVQRLK